MNIDFGISGKDREKVAAGPRSPSRASRRSSVPRGRSSPGMLRSLLER